VLDNMCTVYQSLKPNTPDFVDRELLLTRHLLNQEFLVVNKGNNRTPSNLTKGKSRSQQPENCENRNDPDLVQAFLKKWWVESYFKAPNLPLSLRLKVSLRKLYGRYHDLVNRYGVSVLQMTTDMFCLA